MGDTDNFNINNLEETTENMPSSPTIIEQAILDDTDTSNDENEEELESVRNDVQKLENSGEHKKVDAFESGVDSICSTNSEEMETDSLLPSYVKETVSDVEDHENNILDNSSGHENVIVGESLVHENDIADDSPVHENETFDDSSVHDNDIVDYSSADENETVSSVHENDRLDESSVLENETFNNSLVHDNDILDDSSAYENETFNDSIVHDDDIVGDSLAHENETFNDSSVHKSKTFNKSVDQGEVSIVTSVRNEYEISSPKDMSIDENTSIDGDVVVGKNILEQLNNKISNVLPSSESSNETKDDNNMSLITDAPNEEKADTLIDETSKSAALEVDNTEGKHTALIHEEMLISDDEDSCQDQNKTVEMEENSEILKTDSKIKVENMYETSIAKSNHTDMVNGKNQTVLPLKLNTASRKLKSVKSKISRKFSASVTPQLLSRSITDKDVKVPDGWKRIVVQRQGGASAGKFDVYYISPLGKKLRSRNEATAYCEQNGINLDVTSFIFTHGPPKRGTPIVSSMPKVAKKTGGVTKKRKKCNAEKLTEGEKSVKKIKLSPSLNNESNSEAIPVTGSKIIHKLDTKHIKINTDTLTKSSAKSEQKLKSKIKSTWEPPKSPFSLYQELLYHNPWQLLIGTIFLVKSSGDDELAKNTLWEFIERWSTPESLLAADHNDIVDVIKPLGLHEKRVKLLCQFSDEYLNKKWTYPKDLHGIGKYGNDCYRIFCVGEWRKVKPTDYKLLFYTGWLFDNCDFLQLD